MSRKQSSRNQNNSNNRSQRRLALAVLLVLILGFFWFMSTDNPAVKEFRDRHLMEQSGTAEESTGEDEEQQAAGDGSGSEAGSDSTSASDGAGGTSAADDAGKLNADALPDYNGDHYVTVNGNVPDFPEDVYKRAGLVNDGGAWKTDGSKAGKIESGKLTPYEYYGELDSLGRCTVAYGCLGEETMPAEGTERGDISKIHPSGWARAQNWERCHLIAWALSDENANERNLVTGTHYMNHDGMRPLEEEVEHYIWNTGNHVLYLSRPLYSGDELVPRGVQMTVWSCEDQGKGMSFNVYCFNVTPGAEINYVNGVVTTEEQAAQEPRRYVINTRSGVFHYPSCDGAKSIYKKNRKDVTATRKELTDQGYVPCGYCEP